MLKDQLLDSYELRELRLLDELYINTGKVDKETLKSKLSVSQNVLFNIVESINFRLSNHFGTKWIQYKKNLNTFVLSDHGYSKLGEILGIYAATSINYLLIREYLEQRSVSAEYLTRTLQISRADLYRRMKRINLVLKQFDIEIKDNQLKGNELQLRYFEHIFYQNIFPAEYLFYNPQDYIQFEHLFKHLESYYGADLKPMQKAKLSLWFSNLLKNRQKNREVGEISTCLRQYLKNNIFYNEFTEILINFFKLFQIELTEIDKVSSYLFNLSFFTVPSSSDKIKDMIVYSIERKDIVGQSIADLNSCSAKRLFPDEYECDFSLHSRMFYLYYIFNCHHCSLFFKGYISHLDSTLLHFYQEYNYKDIVVRDWIDSWCMKEAYNHTFLRENKEFILHKYLLYIYHEQSLIKLPLRIGVLLFIDPLMEVMVIDRLQLELSKEHDVQVESYQETKKYDLVVVNVPNRLKKNNFKEEFVITGMGTPCDGKKICERIFDLQANRLKQDYREADLS
ncbi:helix-turn-helix domain-containing protein [Enterococcus faecium]|uniref:helix-turn-helix domain-containing protein n=1 Tax=Enterococcus faecium TaxID=1352 RepID=UPI0008135075|nr:helix-turn-helix domain-containing protein [Enterococcus faecium]